MDICVCICVRVYGAFLICIWSVQAPAALTAELGPISWPGGLQEKIAEVLSSEKPRLSTTLLARVYYAIISSSRKIRNRG